MNLTVVVGNPKLASRTLDAAQVLARTLSGHDGADVFDLALFSPTLLAEQDQDVAPALDVVTRSDTAIFASPTYKATYTEILKLVLDRLPTGTGLENVVAVPLMLGAHLRHTMAADVLLKPILVELGAIAPAPGLHIDQSSEAPSTSISAYVDRWGDAIMAATGGRRRHER